MGQRGEEEDERAVRHRSYSVRKEGTVPLREEK